MGIGEAEMLKVMEVLRKQGLTVQNERVMSSSGIRRVLELNGSGFREARVVGKSRAAQEACKLTHDMVAANLKPMDICFVNPLGARKYKLLVADMDSTLITIECIDELAASMNVKDRVAKITESAMRGEIDFNEALRQRVALLKGMPYSVVENLCRNLPLTEGTERLLTAAIKRLGMKVAVLSGGFTPMVNTLKERFGLQYAFANDLVFDSSGLCTGEIKGEIVNGARKATLLQEVAQREGIPLDQVLAVGDGANDIPMISLAGLGVAFRAKPLTRAKAPVCVCWSGLDALLYLMGFSDADIEGLSKL